MNRFLTTILAATLLLAAAPAAWAQNPQEPDMDKIINTEGKILLVTTNAGHPYHDKIDRMILLPYLPPDPETSSISPVLFDILVELLDSYIARKLSEKAI